MRVAVSLCLLLLCTEAFCTEVNHKRATFNYQMFCQGCHTPNGRGGEAVPNMQGHIGKFLTLPEGREFLVRVPGSANSSLSDERLAEVLNWMVMVFGGSSIPDDLVLYTPEEVAVLRQQPLNEVEQYRRQLLLKISAKTE